MASLSFSNSSTRVGRRMLSEFLQEAQEPFLFQVRKLSNHGGIMRNSRAAAFLKRLLAKLVCSKTKTDNRKSSALYCFSDHSNDHQLSPVSVLELQHSDQSTPSVDDHTILKDECPLPSNTDPPMEASITLQEIHERRRLPLECLKRKTEERILSFQDCLSCPDIFEKAMNELIFSWERRKDDLTNLTQMRASDSSNSIEEWNQFKPETREIGLCLEAAILDELREKAILDMLVLHCT